MRPWGAGTDKPGRVGKGRRCYSTLLPLLAENKGQENGSYNFSGLRKKKETAMLLVMI